MSHYCCLVICKHEFELDELLAPYDENTEDPNCLQFTDMTKNLRNSYEKSKDKYESFEAYLEKSGYRRSEADPDCYGYYSNPDAKWDWWTIGGRWKDTLILKNGKRADSALASDVDFEAMRKEQIAEAHQVYDMFEKIGDNKSEQALMLVLHGLHKNDKGEYPTRQEYIASHCNGLFYSILKNGQWYECAPASWFPLTSNHDPKWGTTESALLSNLAADDLLTIIDCHI